MKTIFLILLLISTALPQSRPFLMFFDGNAVTVKWGGASGDGVTDDYLALQTWIDASAGDSIEIGDSQTRTFLISQPLYLRSGTSPTNRSIINITPTTTIKMVDGDSSLLTADYQMGTNTVTVVNPEYFRVGQWVGVTDSSFWKAGKEESRYGYTDKIIDITGNTLTFAHATPTLSADSLYYNSTVARNGMVGHVQSVIICDSIKNVKISGSGTIYGNGRSMIRIHPVDYTAGLNENWYAGTGIVIKGCDSIEVDGINVRESQMHNISVTALPVTGNSHFSEDIILKNINLDYPRAKNLLVKETNDIYIENIVADSAMYEDGIMFYINVNRATLLSATVTNNGRHGISWNSNCDSLIARNITTSNNGLFTPGSAGISVRSKNAYFYNATLTDLLIINNSYNGAYDVNFDTLTIQNKTATNLISIYGDADTVKFTNLNMTGNNGVALYIDSTIGCSSYGCNGGSATNVSFNNGVITNHTGTFHNIKGDASLPTFTNFAYKPSALTATGRAGTGRLGAIDLAWEDSTNAAYYYIYRGNSTNPTTLWDSTSAKTKTDSTRGSGIWYYRVKGRDANYRTSDYNTTTAYDTVYEFETLRYLAATTTAIDDTNKQRINNFVKARKDSLGIDSLAQAYDVLYLLAGTDSVLTKINLVKGNIGTHNCVVMDTLTWSIRKGWNGNVTGGNNYLNTNYSCYTDSVNFARHNFGIGVYVQQADGYTGVDFGAGNGSLEVRARVRNTADQYYYKMVDLTGAGPSTSSSAAGWTTFERTSTTTTGIYKNGVISVAIGAGNTTNYASSITQNIYIIGYNANGTASFFTPRIYSAFAVRRSFSASENSAEKTDIEAYLDALGVGVIP